MRISSLLQKLAELSVLPEPRSAIDIDLMLDYTRVLYADLLELRSKASVAIPPLKGTPQPTVTIGNEPTLDELTKAMSQEEAAENTQLPKTQTTPASSLNTTPPAPITSNLQPRTSNPQDIRLLISINDKYQIMSELFGNDKAAYEAALNYINASTSGSQAINWLKERLWVTEDHSYVVQSFYDLVRRFKQEA